MKSDFDNIKNVKDYVRLPFVFNHWYVAGYDSEFGSTLTAKMLLGRSIVFYRTETGELTAVQNRCLHRAFPLAEGYLEGGRLVCRYHGIRYDPDGSVARVPCQLQVPDRKLHRYPLHRIGMFVFIWMGRGPADYAKLPKLGFLDSCNFRSVHGAMPLESNYLLMHENLNDLTHFAYLHRDSFPFGDAYLDLPTAVKRTAEGILCERREEEGERVKGALPADLQEQLAGRKVSRWDGGMTISPGVHLAQAPITIGEPDDPYHRVLQQFITHYMTPETMTTSHYWWSFSNDFALGDDAYYTLLEERTAAAFEEDKWAMKQLQRMIDNDDFDEDDLIIAGDRAGMLTRRVVLEWVKAEYGEDVPAKRAAA